MIKKNVTHIAALIIWLVPLGYLAKVYTAMPESVPMHFGIDGRPDRYGTKQELLTISIILSAVSLGIYFLIRFLPKIDPKKTAGYSGGTFTKMAFVLVVFLAAIQLFIIDAAASSSFSLNKYLLPVLGLFFACLGNLMHNVKSNYFIGIRTPWTLEDEDTWRVTHQLAGKLWFAGGILTAIATLLLPFKAGFIVFIAVVAVITLIPVIYSYLYFKRKQKTAS